MSILGSEQALREFFGPRASDFEKKSQMMQKISVDGFVKLGGLSSDSESNQILNTINCYFLGCGISTNLVTQGMELPRTLKKKKKKVKLGQKT